MTVPPLTPARDVFVSYAREDCKFARRLKEALEKDGRSVWLDVDGAYAGEEFWPQICDAIERARVFLFVISPNSVASSFCRDEVQHAVQHNKRIVPVVRSAADERELPAAIAARQWIFLREGDPFDAALSALVTAIDTDLPWLSAHTRLLTQAIAWDTHARDASYLLRGSGLLDAERFLSGWAG